jgi:hypothetical protein
MLEKSKSNFGIPTQAEKGIHAHRANTRPNSKDIDPEYHQQHLHHQESEDQIQSMPQTDLLIDGQTVPGAFWLNESGSPCFSNVDHLLSPGFFISENVFQPFFTGYDNGNGMVDAYDQTGPESNNVPVGLLYNS